MRILVPLILIVAGVSACSTSDSDRPAPPNPSPATSGTATVSTSGTGGGECKGADYWFLTNPSTKQNTVTLKLIIRRIGGDSESTSTRTVGPDSKTFLGCTR